jgi:hypothetical protein
MKKLNLFTLILAIFFIACNSKSEKNSEVSTQIKSSQEVIKKDSDKLYPIQKEIVKFDTLIQNRNIWISIVRKDLDSYVLHESWGEDGKHIDKFRNAEIELTIKQNENILLDTIFRKEQFVKSVGNKFLDIVIFHNYWFEKIDENKIEFLGVITEPETDNTVDFNHYFYFKTNRLKYSESVNSEE